MSVSRLNKIAVTNLLIFAMIAPLMNSSSTRAVAPGIPVKAIIIVDGKYADTSQQSDLYENLKHILDINEIPFDIVDIADINNDTFIFQSNLKYAVMILMNPGWRLSEDKTALILDAVKQGAGVVGLLPDAVNDDLLEPFGILERGSDWLDSKRLRIIKDKFTFSYSGQTIEGNFPHLNHTLLPDADVFINFAESDKPAAWTYQFGNGKTVFHNHSSPEINEYRGILLQSILYAMPVGVASPINAGVIEVDDYPRSFTTTADVQQWHYNFFENFNRWLKSYNFRATFFIAFSYSGNIDDFWLYPESLESVDEIVMNGYGLGIHSGSKHIPLDEAYWDGKSALSDEVDRLVMAMQFLESKLSSTYGTRLGKIVSYVAPMNCISEFGYRLLAQKTGVKYVGTAYNPLTAGFEGSDRLLFADYPVSLRGFGWEPGLNIYNLPRTQGGFLKFIKPEEKQYLTAWNTLRATIESGDAYITYTHPDEVELLTDGQQTVSAELFEAYKAWGDYVSKYYPFYRWWTSSELGEHLQTRQESMKAEWFPGENTLRIKAYSPKDVIHVKTDKYLEKISQTDEAVIIKFSDTPRPLPRDENDVVNLAQDYYIYLKDSKDSRAIVPEETFTIKPVAMTQKQPEVLATVVPMPEIAVAYREPSDKPLLPLGTAASLGASSIFLLLGLLIVRNFARNR